MAKLNLNKPLAVVGAASSDIQYRGQNPDGSLVFTYQNERGQFCMLQVDDEGRGPEGSLLLENPDPQSNRQVTLYRDDATGDLLATDTEMGAGWTALASELVRFKIKEGV